MNLSGTRTALPATIKISEVELTFVEVPASGGPSPIRACLVRLGTDAGLEGWGEFHPRWRPGELEGRREMLLSTLTGRSIYDLEELLKLPVFRQQLGMRCGVEMACWDVIGQAAGEPICHLLGGLYRSRAPVAVRLPTKRLDVVPHLARDLAERGFHSQILTTTGGWRTDLALIKRIREATGDRARLRLDGRQEFNFEQAIDLCSELEEQNLQFVVDPVHNANLAMIARLWRQTSVPLAVSAGIHSPEDVMALVRAAAAPLVALDLEQVGGILSAKHCAVVAQAGGLDVLLAAAPGLGIATAAMLQLTASTPSLSRANECNYHQLQDDVLKERLSIVDGLIAVPSGPGLGIEVDRHKVEAYSVA